MKIAYCSDLHLEFGTIWLQNTEKADILVLAGDICVAADLQHDDTYNLMGESTKSSTYHTFFKNCAADFPIVLYVVGNHEHYHGDYRDTIEKLRNRLGYIKNMYILDNEVIKIEDVTFIGGTLWTDMNKEDPNILLRITRVMNDYRTVTDRLEPVTSGYSLIKKLTPETTVKYHKEMLANIVQTYESTDGPIVVVGHHSPSYRSCSDEYMHTSSATANAAYHSDLDQFIMDRPRIVGWFHGHTHIPFNYYIGNTNVMCNPRGYVGYENSATDFQLEYFTC